jgi:hypothetical protein
VFLFNIYFIIIIDFPGAVSHNMVMAKIGRELTARGHEVQNRVIINNFCMTFNSNMTLWYLSNARDLD